MFPRFFFEYFCWKTLGFVCPPTHPWHSLLFTISPEILHIERYETWTPDGASEPTFSGYPDDLCRLKISVQEQHCQRWKWSQQDVIKTIFHDFNNFWGQEGIKDVTVQSVYTWFDSPDENNPFYPSLVGRRSSVTSCICTVDPRYITVTCLD